jgi:hypothetical protein
VIASWYYSFEPPLRLMFFPAERIASQPVLR